MGEGRFPKFLRLGSYEIFGVSVGVKCVQFFVQVYSWTWPPHLITNLYASDLTCDSRLFLFSTCLNITRDMAFKYLEQDSTAIRSLKKRGSNVHRWTGMANDRRRIENGNTQWQEPLI